MGICSHCVAVAHVNGELSEFVAAKGKQKKTPNVSRLLVTGMPRGRGRKGGVPSRSKKQYQEISRRIEMNVGHVGQMAADSYVEEDNISLHNSPYSTVFFWKKKSLAAMECGATVIWYWLSIRLSTLLWSFM